MDEDAVFCSSYHAAQTTGLRVMGMSVQMGLFPGAPRRSPTGCVRNRGHSFWGSFGENRRTDHGIAAIPHRGGACVSRLRSIRTRTPRCTTHGIYSNLVGTGVPDCPKTTASHTITHSAQTTGCHRVAVCRTARRPTGAQCLQIGYRQKRNYIV